MGNGIISKPRELVISSGRESKARYRSGTESGDCNWIVVISLEELGNSARD
jgi:hypothetical protein